jgi:DNA-binding GntR family transcriptional regulator
MVSNYCTQTSSSCEEPGQLPANAEEIAYSRIRTAIYKRHIRQGSRLAEATLAKQLKLSRTPVRGALKRLAYEGLVEFLPNRGSRVIRPTEDEIRQTFAVRTHLEKMAAGLAAKNVTDDDTTELRGLVAREEQIFKDFDRRSGQTEYYDLNDAIHLRVAKMSANEVLFSHIKDLLNKSKIFLVLFDPYDQMAFNPSPGEHDEIVSRLAQADSRGAEEAMRDHLITSLAGMDFENALPEDHLTL